MKPLDKLFGSKSQLAVLRILCQNHCGDFTISELARETGMDKSAVSKSVGLLEKFEIVLTSTRGRLKLCRINKASKYYDMLEKLFTEESYIENSDSRRLK